MRRRGTLCAVGPPNVSNTAACARKIANWPTIVEHIVAKQHGGSDHPNNLALACHRCNLHKGPNLTGIDSHTGQVAPLLHPRNNRWSEHFVFTGPRVEGTSVAGLATVRVLAMNDSRRVEVRREILKYGDLA